MVYAARIDILSGGISGRVDVLRLSALGRARACAWSIEFSDLAARKHVAVEGAGRINVNSRDLVAGIDS